MGNSENSDRVYFLGLQNQCRWWLQSWNEKTLAPVKNSYDQPRQNIKKQRHYFADRGPYVKAMFFTNIHVWVGELDHKECWALKNWCFWTVMLEKILESPLESKEIKPVNPKRYQPQVLMGRTKAEAPILWPPDAKSRLIWKDPDPGKDWGQ